MGLPLSLEGIGKVLKLENQKMAEGKATIKELDYEMSVFSGPNKDRYGTFGSDAKERMTQILADPNCDPAAEWDAFIEEMMPRVQPVLDELNAGLANAE